MISCLREIIALPAPHELALLHFEVAGDPTEGFPLIAMAFDHQVIQLPGDYADRICRALRALPQLFTEQEEERFIVWESIDERGPVHAVEQPMDGWEEAIFVPWFVECWKSADGGRFSHPATIQAWSWDARIAL